MPFSWEMVVMGLDAAVVIILCELYKTRRREAQAVEDAVIYEAGSDLRKALESAPEGTLHYAGVAGWVQAASEPIRSQFDSTTTGVVQHITMVEHKSQRLQGFWNDVKRVMRDSLTAVPFCLRGDERGGGEGCGGAAGVAVHEPLEAHFLASDLRITHDEFTPAPLGGAFVRGIDRLFGEVSRGLQHTERMLETGAHLTGFGRLTLAGNGRVSLSPPLGDGGYVLTTQTRDDVVRVVRSEARAIAVVAAVAAAVGAAVAAYWWRRQRSEREKLDAVLERVRSRRDSGASAIEGDPCVVCLGRPRELVLLPCGHVCVCADCCQALPAPATCPVCRAEVERVVATYVS